MEKCPCCPNHCSVDNLSCGRGRNYFGKENMKENMEAEPKTLEEQIVSDLRKCGHLLHHNRDLNVADILSGFSEEELNQFHELLARFYESAK